MLIKSLKDILATDPRRVVIIVGAGVTLGALQGTPQAALASWRDLLRSGLRRCEEIRVLAPGEVAGLTAVLGGERPDLWITVAEAVAHALGAPGGGEFRGWLRDTVGSFAPAIREHAVLEALAGLARSGALLATVNYDDLLSVKTGLPPVVWSDRSRVERVINREEPGVLHLHGHWATPESVVLGGRSYEEVVRDEHARAVLSTLRMQQVLVFVGHGAGLTDPNWGSFLRWSEAVHAGSETRHFRLVREGERDQVQAEHPREQRIFAVPYGASYDDLAPFLRGLVPSAAVPVVAATERAPTGAVRGSVPEVSVVVLRVVIGERWYEQISELDIRRQLEGRTIIEVCEYVRFPVAVAEMEAKDWHQVAQGLDDLVTRATAAAQRHAGPVRLVLAGIAPIPVFSYLGLRLSRSKCEILLLNPRRGSPKWDRVGTADARGPGLRDQFLVKAPTDAHTQAGKVVLSLRCATEYTYEQAWVRGMLDDRDDALICSYEVYRPASQVRDPMVASDMGTVTGHVETAMAVFADKCRGYEGPVLAIGGPSWVAFWVAHRLNKNVVGRIHLANFLKAERGVRDTPAYVPALVWPMEGAPWVAGKLRIVVLVAEPDDAVSFAAVRECEAIRDAFETVLGAGGVEVMIRGAARVSQIQRILTELRPHVLHVSAHGSEDRKGRLLFEDAAGDGAPLTAQTFVAMLRASAGSLVAVVASVCYWGPYAEELTTLAKFVVATDAELPYQAGVAFARSFYAGVARGEALGPAFVRAKNDAKAAYPVESVDALRSMHAADVDPDKLALRWPSRRR